MGIEIAKYLGREFNSRSYNCWDFTRDICKDNLGVDIGNRHVPTPSSRMFEEALRLHVPNMVTSGVLEEIPSPEDPCIVWMSRPGVMGHSGVYTGGKVLHIRLRQNVGYDDFKVATMGFTQIRFYRCKDASSSPKTP